MSRYFTKCFVLGAALIILSVGSLGLAGSASANKLDPDLRIRVVVYDYAQIPPKMLIEAEKQAARMFRRAGVELAWLNCPGNQAESSRLPACDPPKGGPTQLQLRVVPRTIAERLSLPNNVFGVALSAPEGRFSVCAYVFAHRVKELAKHLSAGVAGRFSSDVILAHGMTHEIGHLLLGPDSHSPSGIMRPNWTRKDAKLASSGELLFTPVHSKRIRAHVIDRMRAEEDDQAARLGSR